MQAGIELQDVTAWLAQHRQLTALGFDAATAVSVAEALGCHAETLRAWVRQAERDDGTRPGPTTEERQRLKQLERENVELRRANEILKQAAAFFAQAELDRRAK